MRTLAALLIVGLVACDEHDDAGPDPDTDTEVDDTDCEAAEPTCASTVAASLPAPDATDAGYRTPIVVTFEAPEVDASAPFTLATASDAAAVPLQTPAWSTDGARVVLRPEAPLAPSTSYVLRRDPACGTCPDVLAFTTSATGAPVAAEAFAERAYVLDLSTATVIAPEGLAVAFPTLAALIVGDVALVPGTPEEGQLALYAGAFPDGSQDPCAATVDLPAASFAEDPFFSSSATDLVLPVGGTDVPLLALTVSGAFAPDGASIDGLAVATTFDTRAVRDLFADLLDGDTSDGAVCARIGDTTAGGVACQACAADGEPYCLEIEIVGLRADAMEESLERITPDDVASNGACGG